MGEDRKYRLIGSVQAGSRIDRVEVEPPSSEYPEGLALELHKPEEGKIAEGKPLTPDQVTKLSNHVVLELVDEDEEVAEPAQGDTVQQPGLEGRVSQSTVGRPGSVPDVDEMDSDAVNEEIKRLRDQDPNALDGVKLTAKLEERKDALKSHYQERGV